MEAICSSEKSVDFQRPTLRYIPEKITSHNHRCKNLKSWRYLLLFSPKIVISPLAYVNVEARDIQNKNFRLFNTGAKHGHSLREKDGNYTHN
jgi:hypothetical protein